MIDTHVWIWWVDQNPKLGTAVRDQLNREADVRVLAISLLEIATANALNRLTLLPSTDQWLDIAQSIESVQIEPLTSALCLESVRSPGEFHRDPADRLIVALARQIDAPLCTADGKMLAYPQDACVSACEVHQRRCLENCRSRALGLCGSLIHIHQHPVIRIRRVDGDEPLAHRGAHAGQRLTCE